MGAHISVPMYRRTLRQRLLLEGRRCKACGKVQFPPLGGCPDCSTLEQTEPILLSGRGTVYAVTHIMPSGAPPEFAAQAAAEGGYWVAIVSLEDGPRITAQLTAPAAIDQPVQAVIRRLYEQDGVVRYGFKFSPLEVAAPCTYSGSPGP